MREGRNRQDALTGRFDRLSTECDDGTACWLLITFEETTYPTTAGAVYSCHPVLLDTDDTEGDVPTFTADGTVTIHAANIGTTVPAEGTYVIAYAVGGRICFKHDA